MLNHAEFLQLKNPNLSHLARTLYIFYLRPEYQRGHVQIDLPTLAAQLVSYSPNFPVHPSSDQVGKLLDELEALKLVSYLGPAKNIDKYQLQVSVEKRMDEAYAVEAYLRSINHPAVSGNKQKQDNNLPQNSTQEPDSTNQQKSIIQNSPDFNFTQNSSSFQEKPTIQLNAPLELNTKTIQSTTLNTQKTHIQGAKTHIQGEQTPINQHQENYTQSGQTQTNQPQESYTQSEQTLDYQMQKPLIQSEKSQIQGDTALIKGEKTLIQDKQTQINQIQKTQTQEYPKVATSLQINQETAAPNFAGQGHALNMHENQTGLNQGIVNQSYKYHDAIYQGNTSQENYPVSASNEFSDVGTQPQNITATPNPTSSYTCTALNPNSIPNSSASSVVTLASTPNTTRSYTQNTYRQHSNNNTYSKTKGRNISSDTKGNSIRSYADIDNYASANQHYPYGNRRRKIYLNPDFPMSMNPAAFQDPPQGNYAQGQEHHMQSQVRNVQSQARYIQPQERYIPPQEHYIQPQEHYVSRPMQSAQGQEDYVQNRSVHPQAPLARSMQSPAPYAQPWNMSQAQLLAQTSSQSQVHLSQSQELAYTQAMNPYYAQAQDLYLGQTQSQDLSLRQTQAPIQSSTQNQAQRPSQTQDLYLEQTQTQYRASIQEQPCALQDNSKQNTNYQAAFNPRTTSSAVNQDVNHPSYTAQHTLANAQDSGALPYSTALQPPTSLPSAVNTTAFETSQVNSDNLLTPTTSKPNLHSSTNRPNFSTDPLHQNDATYHDLSLDTRKAQLAAVLDDLQEPYVTSYNHALSGSTQQRAEPNPQKPNSMSSGLSSSLSSNSGHLELNSCASSQTEHQDKAPAPQELLIASFEVKQDISDTKLSLPTTDNSQIAVSSESQLALSGSANTLSVANSTSCGLNYALSGADVSLPVSLTNSHVKSYPQTNLEVSSDPNSVSDSNSNVLSDEDANALSALNSLTDANSLSVSNSHADSHANSYLGSHLESESNIKPSSKSEHTLLEAASTAEINLPAAVKQPNEQSDLLNEQSDLLDTVSATVEPSVLQPKPSKTLSALDDDETSTQDPWRWQGAIFSLPLFNLPLVQQPSRPFKMHDAWEPGPGLAYAAHRAGLINYEYSQRDLKEFIAYWQTRPDRKNQMNWELTFIQRLIKLNRLADIKERSIHVPDYKKSRKNIYQTRMSVITGVKEYTSNPSADMFNTMLTYDSNLTSAEQVANHNRLEHSFLAQNALHNPHATQDNLSSSQISLNHEIVNESTNAKAHEPTGFTESNGFNERPNLSTSTNESAKEVLVNNRSISDKTSNLYTTPTNFGTLDSISSTMGLAKYDTQDVIPGYTLPDDISPFANGGIIVPPQIEEEKPKLTSAEILDQILELPVHDVEMILNHLSRKRKFAELFVEDGAPSIVDSSSKLDVTSPNVKDTLPNVEVTSPNIEDTYLNAMRRNTHPQSSSLTLPISDSRVVQPNITNSQFAKTTDAPMSVTTVPAALSDSVAAVPTDLSVSVTTVPTALSDNASYAVLDKAQYVNQTKTSGTAHEVTQTKSSDTVNNDASFAVYQDQEPSPEPALSSVNSALHNSRTQQLYSSPTGDTTYLPSSNINQSPANTYLPSSNVNQSIANAHLPSSNVNQSPTNERIIHLTPLSQLKLGQPPKDRLLQDEEKIIGNIQCKRYVATLEQTPVAESTTTTAAQQSNEQQLSEQQSINQPQPSANSKYKPKVKARKRSNSEIEPYIPVDLEKLKPYME